MDKFRKNLKENEENNRACQNIISNKNRLTFFVVLQLTPETCQVRLQLDSIAQIKKKAFCFFNLLPQGETSVHTIKSLIFIELGRNPLRVLHRLFSEIFVPIMANQ